MTLPPINQKLAEFRRLTGAGKMDRANEMMADIVESMLAMMGGGGAAAQPASRSSEYLASPGQAAFGEPLMPGERLMPPEGFPMPQRTPVAEQGMDTPVLGEEVQHLTEHDDSVSHEAVALAAAAAMIAHDKAEQARLQAQSGGDGVDAKADAPETKADAGEDDAKKTAKPRRKDA